jgi:hypothetical protein
MAKRREPIDEFVCRDCGRHVVSYCCPVLDRRCASCFWIVWNIPDEHQADARERLGVPLAREGQVDE